MSQYTGLAACYDRLIDQTIYDRFCGRICALLRKNGVRDGLVLELCCGTGTLARRLSLEGYELIGCDASPEMLSVAREKCADLPVPPVWICQRADELDLYGTVRAAVCCLDSVNYFTGLRELKEAFRRVSLFLEPGGVFLFDVKSRAMFRELSGTCSIQEEVDLFCTWQYGFDSRTGYAQHQVDLFCREETGWSRFTEWHEQRAYSAETLKAALEQAGLELRGIYADYTGKKAQGEQGRLLFVAKKLKNKKEMKQI